MVLEAAETYDCFELREETVMLRVFGLKNFLWCR